MCITYAVWQQLRHSVVRLLSCRRMLTLRLLYGMQTTRFEPRILQDSLTGHEFIVNAQTHLFRMYEVETHRTGLRTIGFDHRFVVG